MKNHTLSNQYSSKLLALWLVLVHSSPKVVPLSLLLPLKMERTSVGRFLGTKQT
jgi:hypothetical protein